MKKSLILIIILIISVILISCRSKGKEVDMTDMSLEEKITHLTEQVIKPKKDSELGVDNVSITDIDGNKSVHLVVKREMPASPKTLKMDLLIDSKQLLEELSKLDEIYSINLVWENEMVDQFGNGEFVPSMRLTMSKETLDKINWDNVLITQIGDIADDYWQHQALED